MKKTLRGFIVPTLIVIIVLLVVGAGSYILLTQNKNQPASPQSTTSVVQTTSTEQVTSIKVSFADLNLFVKTDTESIIPTKYVDDGIINSGVYAGFHRVVALRMAGEIGSYITYYYFITKDYKSFYFLTNGTMDTSIVFNVSKVVGTVSDVPLNHLETISLGDFILVRQDNFETSSFDQLFDLSGSTELESKSPGLKFYWTRNDYSQTGNATVFVKYVDGLTNVKVKDDHGLVVDYAIKSSESYARQTAPGNIEEYGDPFYSAKNDFVSPSKFFSTYDMPLPGGCGSIQTTGYITKNIFAKDLKVVGITNHNVQLYTFIDPYNEINKAEYEKKISSIYEATYPGAAKEAERMNNASEPTYLDYVSRNPILFVKDPWGRFIMLGEFQYMLPGGCGKPVVYLYPEKATEVKVVLEKPTRFTTDIPTYKNGWSVLAQPDGTLKDLQPQFTNCDVLNTGLFGSEYATEACKNNSYPYLYWAGQVDNIYPQAQVGWVVAQNDLKTFLDSKLSIVGLNEKEKADMLSYWVPELQSKNSPYYRISLFQTQDMNKFAPMKIMPTPDTLIRVFLDWESLANNDLKIPAEKLNHTDRVGFTAVEWGGLKQY